MKNLFTAFLTLTILMMILFSGLAFYVASNEKILASREFANALNQVRWSPDAKKAEVIAKLNERLFKAHPTWSYTLTDITDYEANPVKMTYRLTLNYDVDVILGNTKQSGTIEDIVYENYDEDTVIEQAGLYDENDNLIVSYEDSGIDLSINYTNTNYNTVSTSGYYVLKNNYPNVRKIVLPSSVTAVGRYAFYNCTHLQSVTIANEVTEIREGAFENCSSLEHVYFKNSPSLESIQKAAFVYCENLKDITIPGSVSLIGERAFSHCTSLSKVLFIDGSEPLTISTRAFDYCSGLKYFKLPERVEALQGSYHFAYDTSLLLLMLPDSVKQIPSGLVSNCSSLKKVYFASDLTEINRYAFYKTALEKVDLPDTLNTIGYAAFSGVTTIDNIDVPSSVTTIENNAFANVKHITYSGSATGSPWGALAIN